MPVITTKSNHLIRTFNYLQSQPTDCVLQAGERKIEAHRTILRAVNHVFARIFKELEESSNADRIIAFYNIGFEDLYDLTLLLHNGMFQVKRERMESFQKALRLFDIDFVVITGDPITQPAVEGANQSEEEIEIVAAGNAEVLPDDATANSFTFDDESTASVSEMDQSPFLTIPNVFRLTPDENSNDMDHS